MQIQREQVIGLLKRAEAGLPDPIPLSGRARNKRRPPAAGGHPLRSKHSTTNALTPSKRIGWRARTLTTCITGPNSWIGGRGQRTPVVDEKLLAKVRQHVQARLRQQDGPP